jgi:hypothetical protein
MTVMSFFLGCFFVVVVSVSAEVWTKTPSAPRPPSPSMKNLAVTMCQGLAVTLGLGDSLPQLADRRRVLQLFELDAEPLLCLLRENGSEIKFGEINKDGFSGSMGFVLLLEVFLVRLENMAAD